MNSEMLTMFYKCSFLLLCAMLSMLCFGNPEGIFTSGSIMVGAVALWMCTFIHLDHKLDMLREEMRRVRKMSQVRVDDPGRCQEMPVVPLPGEEKEEA